MCEHLYTSHQGAWHLYFRICTKSCKLTPCKRSIPQDSFIQYVFIRMKLTGSSYCSCVHEALGSRQSKMYYHCHFKASLGCINRTFSSRDHNSVYILEVNRHLGVQQYVVTVYAISIKKPIGRCLYTCSCFNLCSNGICILSDSTHIRSIISISLIW